MHLTIASTPGTQTSTTTWDSGEKYHNGAFAHSCTETAHYHLQQYYETTLRKTKTTSTTTNP
jgi:hypothetical protein